MDLALARQQIAALIAISADEPGRNSALARLTIHVVDAEERANALNDKVQSAGFTINILPEHFKNTESGKVVEPPEPPASQGKEPDPVAP